jgi:hypothetical protein
LTQLVVGYLLTRHEPIDALLISGVPALLHDVIRLDRKSRVPDEGQVETVPLLDAMRVTEHDHGVRAKGIENRADGLDGDRWPFSDLPRHDWRIHSCSEDHREGHTPHCPERNACHASRHAATTSSQLDTGASRSLPIARFEALPLKRQRESSRL